MAVMTTLAIIAGVTLIVGGVATATAYYATEQDRNEARIEEIKTEIKNCDTVISNFNDLKEKLIEGKTYLNNSKKNFADGGHSLDGVPLANDKFNDCIKKIEDATKNIDDIIAEYENNKSELKQEKASLEKKNKESADKMKEANKKQHERRDGALGSPKKKTTNTNKKNAHRY